jgi:hypothetical protein
MSSPAGEPPPVDFRTAYRTLYRNCLSTGGAKAGRFGYENYPQEGATMDVTDAIMSDFGRSENALVDTPRSLGDVCGELRL